MTADASAKAPPEIVFVVAVAENGAIGRHNAMPWHLKSDLKRFKAITMNRPVIMGRKTYQSIGRPLPGRTNIVVTRDKSFTPGINLKPDSIIAAPSLDAAYEFAREDAVRRLVTEIMVIGGADIFAQWMPQADRLDITEVHARPEGDTFLAPIDTNTWIEVSRERHAAGEGDSADYSYVTYRRRLRH